MPQFRPGMGLLHLWSMCVVLLAHFRGRAEAHAADVSQANDSAPKVGDDCCYTDVTNKLQGLIDNGNGIVVRSPDDAGVGSPHKPGSFWSNSIYTPNQFYIWDEPLQELQTWKAHLAVVVADEHKDDLLGGTYYGHDSNSCDSADSAATRCYWEDANQRWNCPGGFKYEDGSWVDDGNAEGAGGMSCRGCHFDNTAVKDFNQDMNSDVVGDYNCNCPSWVADNDYQNYVDTIFAKGYMSDPAWDMDKNICWVDNAVAMGEIQNRLWWTYMATNQLEAWQTKQDYWGWNEIAVAAEVDDPYNQYWVTVMVFLPAASELGITKLSVDEQWDLHGRLQEYENKQRIIPGLVHIAERPGSYIVLAKEEDDSAGTGFRKQFFCEGWELQPTSTATPSLKICFKQQTSSDLGYCYVEYVGCECGVGCAGVSANLRR